MIVSLLTDLMRRGQSKFSCLEWRFIPTSSGSLRRRPKCNQEINKFPNIRFRSGVPSIPPSIMSTWPVIWPDRLLEESTRIWVAMSVGFAIFLSGVLDG